MAKSLIIVESPAKARTLQKYLGKAYAVKASVGHIRDLPVKTLGVDLENNFTPQYVTIRGKNKIITELRAAARQADEIYLAPDPDREGEAIAFHIAESLKSAKKPVYRVLFHELTKKAILTALKNASDVNQSRFEAQQARRILDRLVGYQISPLLWDKVRRGLSAGRVQSVAVRMVCEREQLIDDFVSEEYWSIEANLEGNAPPSFIAKLEKVDNKKVDRKNHKIASEQQAKVILDSLANSSYTVTNIHKKQKKRYPSPPFITSTMQMEANRKSRFSAKKTMMLAQRLYEGVELGSEGATGLITYMRTDSTRISNDALSEAREHIKNHFGPEYLPAKPVFYKARKSAQDAHEAIRPTDVNKTPKSVAKYLDKDMRTLYSLIWKRFVSCQMSPALLDQTTILVEAGNCLFKTTGSIMRFKGFMTLYVESSDDLTTKSKKQSPVNSGGEADLILPDIKEGDLLTLLDITPKQHFTQPLARYTEATLVKALEENGVGRPSTYAATLSTIQDKEYVVLAQRKFSPTDLGKLVNKLLVAHFPNIMDVEFTASMEQQLDQIEKGEVQWRQVLHNFYTPFKKTLDLAKKEMKSIKKSFTPTDVQCALCDGKMVIKWGRNGEFLACEKFPECKHTQDFKKAQDNSIIPLEREKPEESGETCTKCSKPMVYKHGKYGRFLACSGYPECKYIQSISTGVKCAEQNCKGEIVQKSSKRGKIFYSCNKYPKCKFAIWDKPTAQPCPLCKAPFLLEKESKKLGRYLKCNNKDCSYQKTADNRE